MWIWYVSKAQGGNPARIAVAGALARHRDRVHQGRRRRPTAGASSRPGLVSALQRRGLHVCAWQYVYGSDPVGEARVGAAAAADGADCLVIDAEVGVRGSLRAGAHVRHPPAGGGRRRLPARARRLPLRPLPPRLSVLGLPRPGRRRVQPAAGLLEGDRRQRRPGDGDHLHVQPRLRAARSARSASSTTTRAGREVQAASASSRGQAASRAPRGGRGSTPQSGLPVGDSPPRRARRAATARATPTGRWRRGPRATSSSGRRSTWPRAATSTPRSPATTGSSPRAACASSRATAGLSPTGVLDAPTWKALLGEVDPIAVTWGARGPRRRPPPRRRRGPPGFPRARTSSAELAPSGRLL